MVLSEKKKLTESLVLKRCSSKLCTTDRHPETSNFVPTADLERKNNVSGG
jgi:hypothetical protein